MKTDLIRKKINEAIQLWPNSVRAENSINEVRMMQLTKEVDQLTDLSDLDEYKRICRDNLKFAVDQAYSETVTNRHSYSIDSLNEIADQLAEELCENVPGAHKVTQEDIDNNAPDFEDNGVNVGHWIILPEPEDVKEEAAPLIDSGVDTDLPLGDVLEGRDSGVQSEVDPNLPNKVEEEPAVLDTKLPEEHIQNAATDITSSPDTIGDINGGTTQPAVQESDVQSPGPIQPDSAE